MEFSLEFIVEISFGVNDFASQKNVGWSKYFFQG